jgi:hypothetical protein
MQWNIPMLDAREHMQDMDTRGMFPLGVRGVKLQRIYERHCLVNVEKCWGNGIIMRKREISIRLNNARRIMKCNYNSTFAGVSWVMARIVD